MPAGYILVEIHSPLVGIDNRGNLVLNTYGKMGEQVESGHIPELAGLEIPTAIAITNAAGGTQYYCDVGFQIEDCFSNALKGVYDLDITLSDASTGAGLTATTPSGGISAESTDGTILSVYVAGKALRVQTNANGFFGLQIIDSAKTLYYPVALWKGRPAIIGAQLTAGSYHA